MSLIKKLLDSRQKSTNNINIKLIEGFEIFRFFKIIEEFVDTFEM